MVLEVGEDEKVTGQITVDANPYIVMPIYAPDMRSAIVIAIKDLKNMVDERRE